MGGKWRVSGVRSHSLCSTHVLLDLMRQAGTDTLCLLPRNVLIHVGDEQCGLNASWCPDHPTLYRTWRFVFRAFWSASWDALKLRRVEWLPLGPLHFGEAGIGNSRRSTTPASARGHFVGFFGNVGHFGAALRRRHVHQFQHTTLTRVEGTMAGTSFSQGSWTAYANFMTNTSLCLQVPGMSTECYRLYEALETGCVPVVVESFTGATGSSRDAFILPLTKAAGGSPPPFLHAEEPRELSGMLRQLALDGALRDRMQRRTINWWHATRERLRTRVERVARHCKCAQLH